MTVNGWWAVQGSNLRPPACKEAEVKPLNGFAGVAKPQKKPLDSHFSNVPKLSRNYNRTKSPEIQVVGCPTPQGLAVKALLVLDASSASTRYCTSTAGGGIHLPLNASGNGQ